MFVIFMFFDLLLIFLIILLKLLFFLFLIRRNKSKFIKMADLSDFKRGQTVGARMAGANVTKTTELFVSKVMTAFEKEGKKPPH